MDCIGLCTHVASFKQVPISAGHMALHRPSAMIRRSTRTPTRNFWQSHRRSVKLRALQASADTPTSLEAGHMRSRTLYEVLGISQGASAEDIKTAYRKLARKFHPDACVCPEEKSRSTKLFLKIHDAYSTLSDPHGRAQYDRQLSAQVPVSLEQTWNYRQARPAYHSYSYGQRWETDQCW
eukprot:Gb_04902 [translate_table: standard]